MLHSLRSLPPHSHDGTCQASAHTRFHCPVPKCDQNYAVSEDLLRRGRHRTLVDHRPYTLPYLIRSGKLGQHIKDKHQDLYKTLHGGTEVPPKKWICKVPGW